MVSWKIQLPNKAVGKAYSLLFLFGTIHT